LNELAVEAEVMASLRQEFMRGEMPRLSW